MSEISFKTKNQSANFWSAYAKQTIDFQHALAELIDNSLSGRNYKSRGNKQIINATIEITIEELTKNGNIKLQIADDGKGVSLEALTGEDNIFNLGYQSPQKGQMNEHGFGLKNALALLTSGFNTDFSFSTKSGKDIFKVSGPIQEQMIAAKTSSDDWEKDLVFLNDADSGVKIGVEVKPEYFSSLYSYPSGFETLVRRLGEHIGVMYYTFIAAGNVIHLRYKSFAANDWVDRIVPSIPPPFSPAFEKVENRIQVEYASKYFEAIYTHGFLDKSKKDVANFDDVDDWPYPLKIHYQGSSARGGATLTVRDRVLKTGVFREIWPNKAGDVSYNNFLAEIRVNGDFSTTNNKMDLDPHSEVWKLLKEALSADQYQPKNDQRKTTEDQLRVKINKSITNIHNLIGKNKPEKKSVWSRGAEMDIYYEKDGEMYIYELKVEPARVDDVYQLKMYWDGLVDASDDNNKKSPKQAILVASKFPAYILRAVDHVNQLKDLNGNNYNILTQESKSFE